MVQCGQKCVWYITACMFYFVYMYVCTYTFQMVYKTSNSIYPYIKFLYNIGCCRKSIYKTKYQTEIQNQPFYYENVLWLINCQWLENQYTTYRKINLVASTSNGYRWLNMINLCDYTLTNFKIFFRNSYLDVIRGSID